MAERGEGKLPEAAFPRRWEICAATGSAPVIRTPVDGLRRSVFFRTWSRVSQRRPSPIVFGRAPTTSADTRPVRVVYRACSQRLDFENRFHPVAPLTVCRVTDPADRPTVLDDTLPREMDAKTRVSIRYGWRAANGNFGKSASSAPAFDDKRQRFVERRLEKHVIFFNQSFTGGRQNCRDVHGRLLDTEPALRTVRTKNTERAPIPSYFHN